MPIVFLAIVLKGLYSFSEERPISVKRLIRYFVLPVYHTNKRLEQLLEDEHHLRYSSTVFFFLGIMYTISVQLAVGRGVVPAVDPFLKIPGDIYYTVQRFWQIPFFFVTTIIFAGTVRLLSATISGQGRFEQIFSVLCVAQTLPMFLTMWLPETIGFIFFPGKAIMPFWLDVGRQVAGILWPLAVTVIGIVKSEKIGYLPAVLITLVASIPMAALMVIFIR